MRRATAATLVTMLAALALAACGSSGPAGTPNQTVSASVAYSTTGCGATGVDILHVGVVTAGNGG